jgi:hypothetical protein
VSDSEWEGEPHTVTVHAVTLPAGPLDDGELKYDLEHLPSCGEEEHRIGDRSWMEPACELAYYEREIGLAGCLRYSGTPITQPGTYRVASWGRRYYVHDYGAYEYDGGIGLIVKAERPEAGERQ